MSQTTRSIVKSYFETGDAPTQEQFSDFIDSAAWYNEVSDGIKRYVATITQAGNNPPTPTVILNTLGGVPTWNYLGVGSYSLTLPGVFTNGKTIVMTAPGAGNSPSLINAYPQSGTVYVQASSNNSLIFVSIKIEVYP